MWQTGKDFRNKEKRGKRGKGCRKSELIHQPNRQGEQNCQLETHEEKDDRRVEMREGGQQPAAALPELHLFIPAGQTTHLEVKERSLEHV